MNINSESESQPAQPVRKFPFGLVSLIFALLTIASIFPSDSTYQSVVLYVFSALSAIAIIVGEIDLYLINRKVPVDGILALITTVLTIFALWMYGFLYSYLFFMILFVWGFVNAIIQIILLIKNRVAILARLGIILALLCNVFVVIIITFSQ
jgi:hypothetical protein